MFEALSMLSTAHNSCHTPYPPQAKQSPPQLQKSVPPKRKYRWHPPRDSHAPPRPQSGYVLFSNYLRQNPEVSDLPFIEIAKLVGQQWACLTPPETTTWLTLAADKQSKYKAELLQYRQTADYQRHQDCLRAYKEGKLERGRGRSEPRNNKSKISSKDSRAATKETQDREYTSYVDIPGTLTFTSSSSALSDYDQAQYRHRRESNAMSQSTHDSLQAPSQYPIPDNDWIRILWDYQSSISRPSSVDIDTDLHTLRTMHSTEGFRSCYIQDLNPFHAVSQTTIWQCLNSFLQRVNAVYNFVETEHIVQQFLLATDTNNKLPNHIMYTLCFCISIGCQVQSAGTGATGIIWYEHGRRYLDNDGWGMDLNVMRALVLMSVFHMDERPATAHRYLVTALQIGIANHFVTGVEEGVEKDGSSTNSELATLSAVDGIKQRLGFFHL